MLNQSEYLENLKKRGRESKVYQKHQLIGLEVAQILGDERHKSLYIKLAKENNPQILLELAKRISDKKDVKNRGAYFMKILSSGKKSKPSDARKSS